MNLVNKLKPYALVLGLGLGALASDGCASASLNNLVWRRKSQTPEITLVPFQEYSPVLQRRKLKLEDRMLQTYVSESYSIDELSLSILNRHLVEDIETDPLRRLDIQDFDRFREGVPSTANELGYSEEGIRNLSIQDALMLSGKIVAHRLDYNHDMISKDEEKLLEQDPEISVKIMLFLALSKMSGKDIDLRNDEARSIDNASKDRIFFDGAGVCRNYAGVNSAVFEVLKGINPNLKNTYMRWYVPEELGHSFALPHAWNQVSTITRDEDGLDILVTYVDPTWLDTRDRTVSDDREGLEVSDGELYEALDEAHFGNNLLYADKYLAELYETLGKDYREVSLVFRIPRETARSYMDEAFNQRIETCEKVLDVVDEKPEEFEKIDYHFGESFQRAVENLVDSPTGIFLESSYAFPIDKEKFRKLSEVYGRALSIVPEYVSGDNLRYERVEHPDSNTVNFIQDQTSMQNLFERINGRTYK